MGDNMPEAEGEHGAMEPEAGGVNVAKILLFLVLVVFGSIMVLWLSFGQYRRTLEITYEIELAWLPIMLIPLWLLFALAAVVEVRRARKESATATVAPPEPDAETADHEPSTEAAEAAGPPDEEDKKKDER